MKIIIMYGVPAHGHINATLHAIKLLVTQGYRVIYYATDEFKQKIEDTGAKFQAYQLESTPLNLQDASRLFRFYRILLDTTYQLFDKLCEEAQELQPCLICHDSVATWGKYIGQTLQLPTVSFYSLMAINHYRNRSFWNYALNFSSPVFKDINELNNIFRLRRQLKQKYNFTQLNMFQAMMNKGTLNIVTYHKALQIGGEGFADDYFFLGPTAAYREQESAHVDECNSENLIYVSLGTIFNTNEKVFQRIIDQLGQSKYTVLITNSAKDSLPIFNHLPKNIIVKKHVNQEKVLKKASVFITAGGMNSVNEALKAEVPMLIIPQQGEQKMIAKQIQKLGFGQRYHTHRNILKQVSELTCYKKHWNKTLSQSMTQVHDDDLLKRINTIVRA